MTRRRDNAFARVRAPARLVHLERALGILQRCFVLGERGARLTQRCLVCAGIDHEQELPLHHGRSFAERDFPQEPGHLRPNLDGARGFRLTDELSVFDADSIASLVLGNLVPKEFVHRVARTLICRFYPHRAAMREILVPIRD